MDEQMGGCMDDVWTILPSSSAMQKFRVKCGAHLEPHQTQLPALLGSNFPPVLTISSD